MRVGEASFAEEDSIDDVVVAPNLVEKMLRIPVDAGGKKPVPIVAGVNDPAFVTDGVEALDIIEAGAEHIDSHTFRHSLCQIRDENVIVIEVRLFEPVVN